jgi:hypothetical protein
MNERIQQLADQAGYKPLPGFDFANTIEETYLEKFAQLIVQECVDYCGENLSKTVGGALKIHLGVDE